jgi:hypothetical protein
MAIGSTVTINPGGATHETVRITNILANSFSITPAIQFPHTAGETIRFQPPAVSTVYWGYVNPNSQSVTNIAGSSSNFFSPGSPERGQPSVFLPGTFHRVVSFPFHTGRDQVWIIGSQVAIARYTEAQFCDAPRPPAVTGNMVSIPVGTTLTGASLGSTELTGPGVTASVSTYEVVTSFIQGCSTMSVGNISVQNGVIFGDVTSNSTPNRCFTTLRVNGPGGAQNSAMGILQSAAACTASVTPPSLSTAIAGVPYSVTFNSSGAATYSIEGALPAGLSLSGATLSGTPQQTGSFPFVLRTTGSDGCFGRTPYTLGVTGATCATTITPQVQITLGGFRQNLVNRHWLQTVTIRNGGTSNIGGPVAIALDNLSANAALSNVSGVTACSLPLGRPYLLVDVGTDGVLSPGESVSATLDFTNSNSAQAITYTPAVLAGGSAR